MTYYEYFVSIYTSIKYLVEPIVEFCVLILTSTLPDLLIIIADIASVPIAEQIVEVIADILSYIPIIGEVPAFVGVLAIGFTVYTVLVIVKFFVRIFV